MDIPATKKALLFYRIMAWVVGVLLAVLVLVGMPLKYGLGDGRVVTWTGVPHGWLYVLLLIAAFNLKYKAKWDWGWFIKIALAGTVPFLSFVAEHFATKDVRRRIAAAETKQARRKSAQVGSTDSDAIEQASGE
ncbi:DUF3817 domain-containing protein [Enemella sp. A6]|uniref:DUF3817 domain-containing protein n=1 Tax=Enemella sp. A6 TaxID=3440152 RepID=UPI003EB82DC5